MVMNMPCPSIELFSSAISVAIPEGKTQQRRSFIRSRSGLVAPWGDFS
jgi:hypothetical protein